MSQSLLCQNGIHRHLSCPTCGEKLIEKGWSAHVKIGELAVENERLKIRINIQQDVISKLDQALADLAVDLLHPEFGTEWREPDGVIYKAVIDARREALQGLLNWLIKQDNAGEIGGCCANPYCRACTILDLIGDYVESMPH